MGQTMRLARILFLVTCLCALARAAGADTLTLESSVRTRLSLNGKWKMHAGDDAAWSGAGFDHSAWTDTTVPGQLPASKNGARTIWFRKSFTPPAGADYGHLRLERVLDRAQVWINGRKLTNPDYPKPFETTQFGVFGKIWSMDWPDYFDASGLVTPGRENVIAVRVESDSARSTKTFETHPEITASGAAGILGDVYLVTRPPVHIRSIERIHPMALVKGRMETHIYLLLSNETLKTQTLSLTLKIVTDSNGGHAVFDEQRNISLAPGGELYDFQWNVPPSFTAYRAVATLRRGPALVDTVSLRFQGQFISAGSGGLVVNGERFTIRGVHGNPGLVNDGALVQRNTFKWEWMERDLDALRAAGANTLHTLNPTPRLMSEALSRGIMVVPALTSADFSETAFAIKEYPNILFWELSTDRPQSLYVMASLIAAVDPYRRPMAYRGSLRLKPGDRAARNISLAAVPAQGANPSICSARGASPGAAFPAYLFPWDSAGAGVSKAGPAQAGMFLSKTWHDCVTSGEVPAGGIYTTLTTQGDALPGLRNPADLETDSVMVQALKHTFRELEPDYYSNAAGSRVLSLSNTAMYPLRDVKVYLNGVSRPAGKQTLLAPGRRFNMSPSGTPGAVIVAYTTHDGLSRMAAFDLSEPLFLPERFRFETQGATLKPGAESRATAFITNHTGTLLKYRLTLKTDMPGVSLAMPSRSIIVQPGDTARVAVTVRAARNAKPAAGAAAATLSYEDTRWHDLTAVLPITIK